MWFKIAKFVVVVNTKYFYSRTRSLIIVSNDPNVVKYGITKNVIKYVK